MPTKVFKMYFSSVIFNKDTIIYIYIYICAAFKYMLNQKSINSKFFSTTNIQAKVKYNVKK